MKQFIFICFFHLLCLFVQAQSPVAAEAGLGVADTAFWQEYHQGFIVGNNEGDNDIRSIAVDESSNIWIATASGIFIKERVIQCYETIYFYLFFPSDMLVCSGTTTNSCTRYCFLAGIPPGIYCWE